MKLENKILRFEKKQNLTVENIEKEINRYGIPLRWAIVDVEDVFFVIDAVVEI